MAAGGLGGFCRSTRKIWPTASKQQLNPCLTQVRAFQDDSRGEVRPGLRRRARELLERDKRKDELDLSFGVKQTDLRMSKVFHNKVVSLLPVSGSQGCFQVKDNDGGFPSAGGLPALRDQEAG